MMTYPENVTSAMNAVNRSKRWAAKNEISKNPESTESKTVTLDWIALNSSV
jgi:hypothetical protein